jgi:hypothetical protein
LRAIPTDELPGGELPLPVPRDHVAAASPPARPDSGAISGSAGREEDLEWSAGTGRRRALVRFGRREDRYSGVSA